MRQIEPGKLNYRGHQIRKEKSTKSFGTQKKLVHLFLCRRTMVTTIKLNYNKRLAGWLIFGVMALLPSLPQIQTNQPQTVQNRKCFHEVPTKMKPTDQNNAWSLASFFFGVNFVISKTFQKFNKISQIYTRKKKPFFFPIFSPKILKKDRLFW
jgi:hypothetical protein